MTEATRGSSLDSASLSKTFSLEVTLMQYVSKGAKLAFALALAVFAIPHVTRAQHYVQKNLVADPSGAVFTAPITDPNLINPWGLARSPNGSPFWIGDNNSGTSTLYGGD